MSSPLPPNRPVAPRPQGQRPPTPQPQEFEDEPHAMPARKPSASLPLLIGIGASAAIVLAIVAVVIIVLLKRQSIGTPTAATTDPGKLDPIVFAADISSLVSVPAGSGAEATYNKVYDLANRGYAQDFIEKVKSSSEPEKDAQFKPILDLLIAGAGQGLDPQAELVFTSANINPSEGFSVEDRLKSIGDLACRAANSQAADKKMDEAIRSAQAALIFGQRLWNQGVYRASRIAGLGIMGEALAVLKDLYERQNQEAKASAIRDIDAARMDAALRWIAKEKLVRVLNDAMNPADLANLAANDKDRTWRIEGMMWLGIAQWTSASGSRREAIQAFLSKHSSSSDPIIAEKAKQALHTTREDIGSFSGM